VRISISAAKTQLPALVRRVQMGERFVLTKFGRPVALLRGFKKREPGPDDWVAQAIKDILNAK
jgi:prevent-host-death family protein